MRARNVKPGFFGNEFLATLSPHCRLLFVGLWCLADRRGRLEDRPLKIKGQVFPFESVDVEALLSELADSPGGFIQRYQVGGQAYVQIENFSRHQNPHCKEKESDIPPPSGEAPCLHHASTVLDTTQVVTSPEKAVTSPADSGFLIPDSRYLIDDSLPDGQANTLNNSVESEGKGKRATQVPEDWQPSPELVAWAENEHPGLNVQAEASQFVDHHRAKGTTFKDHNAAFRNWCRNASKWAKPPSKATPKATSAAHKPWLTVQECPCADCKVESDKQWRQTVEMLKEMR